MEQEYRYRSHVRWGQYVIIPFYFLLSVSFIGGAIASDSRRILLLLFAGVAAVSGALLGLLYRRLATTRVSFDNEGVVLYRGKHKTHLPFEEISRLSFPSINYLGGWIKIISNNVNLRVTVALRNISEFLIKLKSSLDDRELSERYDQRKFLKLIKMATYGDQSFERFNSIVWKLVLLSGLATVLGIVLVLLSNSNFAMILVWITVSLLWSPIIYLIAELVLMRRFAKSYDLVSHARPVRDIPYEKALFRKTMIWGAIIYLATSLLLIFVRL